MSTTKTRIADLPASPPGRGALYINGTMDGAYKNELGRRCAKRHDLEFHHRRPFGRGGDHSPSNPALM